MATWLTIAALAIVGLPFIIYFSARLISKAWHKSKNEETIYHG